MIVATGSPERAELVAGMVEHVIGRNAEGELDGGAVGTPPEHGGDSKPFLVSVR
jgi:hypothetical protein